MSTFHLMTKSTLHIIIGCTVMYIYTCMVCANQVLYYYKNDNDSRLTLVWHAIIKLTIVILLKLTIFQLNLLIWNSRNSNR